MLPGRLDVALLNETLSFNDYDFYLCGPAAFMQSLYDGLRKLNIADSRIHAEAFGPAGLHRQTDVERRRRALYICPRINRRRSRSLSPARKRAGTQIAVRCWISPSHAACRRSSVVAGAVAAPAAPASSKGRWRIQSRRSSRWRSDEALICCAVPAQAETGGAEHLLLDL